MFNKFSGGVSVSVCRQGIDTFQILKTLSSKLSATSSDPLPQFITYLRILSVIFLLDLAHSILMGPANHMSSRGTFEPTPEVLWVLLELVVLCTAQALVPSNIVHKAKLVIALLACNDGLVMTGLMDLTRAASAYAPNEIIHLAKSRAERSLLIS